MPGYIAKNLPHLVVLCLNGVENNSLLMVIRIGISRPKIATIGIPYGSGKKMYHTKLLDHMAGCERDFKEVQKFGNVYSG